MKLTLIFALICTFFLYYLFRAGILLYIGHEVGLKAVPYSQAPANPTAKILIVGDSTAVGTGAQNQNETVAGYLGADYPQAKIDNLAVNGMRGEALLKTLQNTPVQKYDLVLIFTGGGDTLVLRDPAKMEIVLGEIILEAKKRSTKVVLMPPGNVGLAPFIPFFLTSTYSQHTHRVLERFKRVAIAEQVYYVDSYIPLVSYFQKSARQYYGRDSLHLSAEGHKWWYERLKKVILENNLL